MTQYYQETDSKIVFALPYELGTCAQVPASYGPCFPSGQYAIVDYPRLVYAEIAEPEDETTGGRFPKSFLPPPEQSSLVRAAWSVVDQTESPEVARETRRLLSIVGELVSSLAKLGFDMGNLTPLRAWSVEDGSILVEWIFTDFRIGFSIEPDPDDSSWYLVSNQSLGDIGASGYLTNKNVDTLVLWLLNFAMAHS